MELQLRVKEIMDFKTKMTKITLRFAIYLLKQVSVNLNCTPESEFVQVIEKLEGMNLHV